MELKKTIENFLIERREGNFYDSSIVTYKRKLEVFFEFLYLKCGISDDNFQELLRGIGEEKIINSIEYYVYEYDIKFKVTVENFFTVIKGYFDFISSKYNIKNDNFDSTQKYSNLKLLVDRKIGELGLNTSRQKPPITKVVFNTLNKYCNEKIDVLSKYELINCQLQDENNYNKPLVEFISAIATKLVMLTGIKNQVIGKIAIKDLCLSLNKIRINSYWIHLPDRLGMQFRKYMDVRSEIAKDKSEEAALFINKQGYPINNEYRIMFEVLVSVVGDRKAECVSKYTIMNMIRKGINSTIIQEFTSFGSDTFLHCQELVNEEKSKEDLRSKSRYIDSKIRSLESFDEL